MEQLIYTSVSINYLLHDLNITLTPIFFWLTVTSPANYLQIYNSIVSLEDENSHGDYPVGAINRAPSQDVSTQRTFDLMQWLLHHAGFLQVISFPINNQSKSNHSRYIVMICQMTTASINGHMSRFCISMVLKLNFIYYCDIFFQCQYILFRI